MRRLVFLAALALPAAAAAERGLVTLSLQSGQLVAVAPVPLSSRTVPLWGTLTYGLSERWSLGGSTLLELGPGGGPSVALGVGPRLALYRDYWLTVELVAAAEAGWVSAVQRVDLAVRAGVSVRYLLLWGLGVLLEGGVRGRAEAVGPFVPGGQVYLVGGLYIEA